MSWDASGEDYGQALRAICRRRGPHAVGVLASARATNEDNYLLQKFARVVLGTNNVDGCARVCHAPSAAALGAMFGTGAATNSFADIEAAATILVCGANATENHPVVGARIKQAARHGAALDRRRPASDRARRVGHDHLQLRPGTNVALLNAMAAVIVEEGLVDTDFARERVDGLDDYARHISDTPRSGRGALRRRRGDIRAAARLYARNRPSLAVHGLGVTEHTQGTDGVMCIVNLALLTATSASAAPASIPLRGQNNVQGSAHMGCEPHHLTGYAPHKRSAAFRGRMGRSIPAADGLDAMEMIDAAAGHLDGLWVVGWDILQTQPDMTATEAALGRLELLVVQDLF